MGPAPARGELVQRSRVDLRRQDFAPEERVEAGRGHGGEGNLLKQAHPVLEPGAMLPPLVEIPLECAINCPIRRPSRIISAAASRSRTKGATLPTGPRSPSVGYPWANVIPATSTSTTRRERLAARTPIPQWRRRSPQQSIGEALRLADPYGQGSLPDLQLNRVGGNDSVGQRGHRHQAFGPPDDPWPYQAYTMGRPPPIIPARCGFPGTPGKSHPFQRSLD